MAVLDNTLQALFNMAHKELIWKNATPTSSFLPQTIIYRNNITLNDGDWIAVKYISFAGQYSGGIVLSEVGKSFAMDAVTGSTGQYTGGYFATGRAGTATKTGVIFYSPYFSTSGGAWTLRDDYLAAIPAEIWLIGR